ncbi:MAG: hypothetical protein AAGC76_03910 [Luteibacter sp.]|uniref:hypothetical protein n=1 Tax=Luteibacter sp. TaxID=1886636 RepID=UPI002806DC03|nr:hypothetical protein [Luteibacter sp.]MDQ7994980.1 hypothetical protein [Luteibacter sp.]
MAKKYSKKKVARHKCRRQPLAPPRISPAKGSYDAAQSALETLFTGFHAREVYVALLASDLWPLNIAARVKHIFAYALLASIPPEHFTGDRHIDSHVDLTQFLDEMYGLLPEFPTLEDYTPERDWGEIKSVVDGMPVKVFYGGTVERITDFVDAFRLAYPANSAAVRDLNSALMLQDALLSMIDDPALAEPGMARRSDLHVPSDSFWGQCHAALPALARTMAAFPFTADLTVPLGTPALKKRMIPFGEAFLSGEGLPYVLLDIHGETLPLSPRDAVSTAMHHWERRALADPRTQERGVSANLAAFVQRRIRHAAPGPYRIALRDGSRQFVEVPTAFRHEDMLWLVVVLSSDRVPGAAKIEQTLRALFAKDHSIIAMDLAEKELVVLADATRDAVEVNFIVVTAEAAIDPAPISHPPATVRLYFLPDFVSIIQASLGLEELMAYFRFVDQHRGQLLVPFSGPVDQLAAFRQSHGTLIDGAVMPNMIFLDPHWGSNWRFEEQTKFWRSAPAHFPDDDPTTWLVEPSSDGAGLLCLKARAAWDLDWVADLPTTSVHFMLNAYAQDLPLEDGRLLETFIHMLADAMVQRRTLLPSQLFRARVVTRCLADETTLPSQRADDETLHDKPVLCEWGVLQDTPESLVIQVRVNLACVRNGLQDAHDARFEAEGVAAWIVGLASLTGIAVTESEIQRIRESGKRPPRFTTKAVNRPVDLPDHVDPVLPTPAHFKAARRELAIIIRASGAAPGRFELSEAKAIIDPARQAYRARIHQSISQLARTPVLLFAIEQFDALVANYDRQIFRIRMSLSHEVDFDREHDLAEAHAKFVSNVRNYRYLLEVALSSPPGGDLIPSSESIAELVAKIDWLMVLDGASDTLHNAIDVGGIDLSDSFVPEVFYASDGHERFGREMATDVLGGGDVDDAVSALSELEVIQLNEAMQRDAGFKLTHLLQTLELLYRWPSVHERPDDVHLSYQATPVYLIAKLTEMFHDIDSAEAECLVKFLTLAPERVRVLSGRETAEQDVPIWEHRKRDHRYSIRPLIALEDGRLAWGAGAAYRARGIWGGSLSDGYPPAELPWPHVESVALAIKRRIEKELETRAFTIMQRHATYVLSGVNFKKRFTKEGYSDVGDFDVLAYWPERNLWVTVECKYNKPAYCLKDARRLRDYIFGEHQGEGHVGKVERRHAFLVEHMERLRALLSWPTPGPAQPVVCDLYVGPRIFYWMRDPPYPVHLQFVRLGLLDSWLTSMFDD